jgi:hypothetical protein
MLHPGPIAVYLPGQMPGTSRQLPGALQRLKELLEFHPWMLALAVFLACAIGIAAMEQLRDRPTMLAQASARSHR